MTRDARPHTLPEATRVSSPVDVDSYEGDRLRAVAALGQRALIVTDLSVLMQDAVALVAQVLGVAYCQVLELLPTGDAFTQRAVVGTDDGLVLRVAIGGDTESLPGYTLSSDAPVVVEDFASENRFRDVALRETRRIVSSLSVRLHGQERPVGVLAAHATERRRFGEGDVHFLQAVANVIATAMERKRAEQKAAALLQVARDITGTVELDKLFDRVQRRAAELLLCDRICSFCWDPEREVFCIFSHYGMPAWLLGDAAGLEFRRGDPLIELIWNGETVVINDGVEQNIFPAAILTHFGISSLAIAPLIVRGPLLGALVAMRTQAGHRFDTSQVQLLEAITGQLAVAVDATELFRTQREEAELSAALVNVGQELISSLDTPVILDRLCQLTTELLGCDWSHTWLPRTQDDGFELMSSHGHTREQYETLRVVKLPHTTTMALLTRLVKGPGLIQFSRAQLPSFPLPVFTADAAITRAMYVPLLRGTRIVGLLVAGYRGREEPFTTQQERLVRGITHLASLALEHARTVEELERANHLKSDFLATMSHELRTPLNVILGYNQLILDLAFGPLTPEQTDTARRIGQNAHNLLELINATLDVGRLEAGQVPLDLGDVAVSDIVSELDIETRELRQKPGVSFAWLLPTDLPPLRTDRVKLKVVIKNLIANALKFTDAGHVTVQVQSCAHDEQPGIQFCVTDTGLGIPREALSIIFEPFRQVDDSITRRHGGAGLGLYIVRRLLELLGGTLAVDSQVGHGTTFCVWVPTQRAAPTQRVAIDGPQ